MRHVIHDKMMAGLMVLLVAVTIFAALLGARNTAILQIDLETEGREKYPVDYVISSINQELAIQEDSGNDIAGCDNIQQQTLIDFPQVEGNLILIDYTHWRLYDSVDYIDADVYLAYHEVPLKQLQEGRYPEPEEITGENRYAVIGAGMLDFTEERENKRYLKTQDAEFQVVGVLKDISGSEEDYRVEVFYDSLSEEEKTGVIEKLNGIQNTFFYQCSTETEGEIPVLEQWIKQHFQGADCAFVDLNTDDSDAENSLSDISEIIYKLNSKIDILIYIFGLISCLSILRIWTKRRNHEYWIRWALGESRIHIFLRFAAQMAGICIFGMVCALVLFLCLNVRNGSMFLMSEISIQNILYQILTLYLAVLILFVMDGRVRQ